MIEKHDGLVMMAELKPKGAIFKLPLPEPLLRSNEPVAPAPSSASADPFLRLLPCSHVKTKQRRSQSRAPTTLAIFTLNDAHLSNSSLSCSVGGCVWHGFYRPIRRDKQQQGKFDRSCWMITVWVRIESFPLLTFCFVISRKLSSTKLHPFLSKRWFQLEEMEDKDSATTEVFLNPDLSVDFAETNGPLYLEAAGSWKQDDEGAFEMVLKRTFESGQKSKEATDVGPVTYSTLRTFKGQMGTVGGKVSMEGSIHDSAPTSGEDRKVGFFEMIDTTEEMGSDHKRELKGRSAAS